MSATVSPVPVQGPLLALVRLWRLAQGDHGGSRVAVKLLLGLYNGSRFPFDLTELRCLDADYLQDALQLIAFDSRPQMEVHEWLNRIYGRRDMGSRFETLAFDWKLKGRCKREWLSPVQPLGTEGWRLAGVDTKEPAWMQS